MKILVIKFRNIGDVLLAGPLITTLARRRNENNQVDALVKPGTEEMLLGHPDVGEVLTCPVRGDGESRRSLLTREIAFVRKLRKRRYDMVINTTEGDRGTLYAFFSGAATRIGMDNGKGGHGWRRRLLTEVHGSTVKLRHMVLRNLDLAPAPADAHSRRVRLEFSAADRAAVERHLRAAGWIATTPMVQIHPTSRWLYKCWNDIDVARVIDHLALERRLQVVLTCGPARRELDKLDNILGHCRSHPLNLGGRLSLKETAALSARCRLFFGVDTAPMHMAAALDVPVVAVYGPTGTHDWGPWPNDWQGDSTPYPAGRGIQHCRPHTVIQKNWPCVPCGRDGCGGTKRSACMLTLPAEIVIAHIEATLERLGLGSKSRGEPTAGPES